MITYREGTPIADCPSCHKTFCTKCEKSYHGPDDDCLNEAAATGPWNAKDSSLIPAFGARAGIDKRGWAFLNSLIGLQKCDKELRLTMDNIVDEMFARLREKNTVDELRKMYSSSAASRDQLNRKYGEPFVRYYLSSVSEMKRSIVRY